jgi:YegS/Rv2252/BmrU family lipid kinase
MNTATSFQKPVFVVNPNSANGSTRKEWPHIESLLKRVLPKYDTKFTARPMDATRLASEALHEGADLVISVGGDGTHNEVVNGFFADGAPINPTATLAVLSRGTGGDFRKTLGLSRCSGAEMKTAVEQLAACRVSPCDVGRLTFRDHAGVECRRYFVNITSFGMGGEVDKRVNESSKALGGKVSFFLGSLRATMAYKNRNVRVTVDGVPFYEGPIYNIAVANGKFFGGGMMIAPDARIDDGQFDVVACGDFNFVDALQFAAKVYGGKHLALPKIRSTRGSRVEAVSDEEVLLDVDGEAPGKLSAIFENLAGAIRVLRK